MISLIICGYFILFASAFATGGSDPPWLLNPLIHLLLAGVLLSVLVIPAVSARARGSLFLRGATLTLAIGFAVSFVRTMRQGIPLELLLALTPSISCSIDAVVRIVLSPPRPGRDSEG